MLKSVSIYQGIYPKEDCALISQLRKSVENISSNIAEGLAEELQKPKQVL
ncbi:four helix bundle protein [Chryseobacterium nepalense]